MFPLNLAVCEDRALYMYLVNEGVVKPFKNWYTVYTISKDPQLPLLGH